MKLGLVLSGDTLGFSLVTKNHTRLFFFEKETTSTGFRISFIKEKYVRYSK